MSRDVEMGKPYVLALTAVALAMVFVPPVSVAAACPALCSVAEDGA